MLKEWLHRRRTRALANDAVKSIPRVIGRYGELMEKRGGKYMTAIIGVAIIGGVFYLNHEVNRPEGIVASQGRCAKQAERVVAGSSWKQSDDPVNGIVASYMDHYNARVGKCFMLFKFTINDRVDNETRKSFSLRDAFKQATYAEYFESDLPGFNPLVSTCSVTMPNEKPIFCHSNEEWNRLIKPYIETGALAQ